MLLFVYLMCGPRQLFFFLETPKGWTPLLGNIVVVRNIVIPMYGARWVLDFGGQFINYINF